MCTSISEESSLWEEKRLDWVVGNRLWALERMGELKFDQNLKRISVSQWLRHTCWLRAHRAAFKQWRQTFREPQGVLPFSGYATVLASLIWRPYWQLRSTQVNWQWRRAEALTNEATAAVQATRDANNGDHLFGFSEQKRAFHYLSGKAFGPHSPADKRHLASPSHTFEQFQEHSEQI